MTILIFILFAVISLSLSFSTLVGLPGGWIFFSMGILIELADTHMGLGNNSFGWWIIGASLFLLIFSEIVELISSMIGTKFGGGSKKGMWASFWGTIVGAIVGTFIIPIPLIGTLLGSLVGAFLLAYSVESNQLETSGDALKSAIFGTIGRLLGTFGKFGLTIGANIIMIGAMTVNYFF